MEVGELESSGKDMPGDSTLKEHQMPQDSVNLCSILSLDASKWNPIHFLTPQTIIMFCGSTVIIFDTQTGEQKYLWGRDEGGIGAVAVHPSQKLFAVAEKCSRRAPNVYLYSYPELELVKTLENGTERAYSAASFNPPGDMLATVGSYPDYLLTLWDWKSESSILRCKAFSQEVYNVQFSPYIEGHLITSGTGHIRFWKMANTFTGLKLQGMLGKFGKVELSDVCAFTEMEDGKLLSGTEFGQLLLWDGELIKAVLTREGGKACHLGNINVVEHDVNKGTIITGGADGIVRIWDYTTIKDAEPDDDTVMVEISPLDEVFIAEGCQIKSLIWDRKQWIIFADSGALYELSVPDFGPISKASPGKRLLEFNSNSIVGLECVDEEDGAITAGCDGSVRLYNYIEKKLIYKTVFSSPASHLMALPQSLDPERRTILVGFEDGTVRALRRCSDGWNLLSAFKPHKAPVATMSVASTAWRLATGSTDGRIFFFEIENSHTYNPIAYTTVGAAITTTLFTPSETHVIVGCANGQILKVEVPHLEKNPLSFERSIGVEDLEFQMPRMLWQPDSEVKQEATDAAAQDGVSCDENGNEINSEQKGKEEELPEFISSWHQKCPVFSFNHEQGEVFSICFGGVLAGTVFRCCLQNMVVLATLPGPSSPISVLKYCQSGKFLLMGTEDGTIRISPCIDRGCQQLMDYWERSVHDGQNGKVTGVAMSSDDQYLLSVAKDMTFYVQKVMIGDERQEVQEREEQTVPSKSDDKAPKVKDIVDENAYTIEEAKQKEEQDALLAMAEAKKRRVRDFVHSLRCQFEEIIEENDSRGEGHRIPRKYLEIDSGGYVLSDYEKVGRLLEQDMELSSGSVCHYMDLFWVDQIINWRWNLTARLNSTGLRDTIEQQTRDREDVARKEMQWEQEKTRLSVKKLKDKYFQDTVVEHSILKCFGSEAFITTFCTSKLPEGINEHLDHLEAKIEMERSSHKDQETSMGLGITEHKDIEHGGGGYNKGVGFKTASVEEGVPGQLSKTDIRRIARKKREEAWGAYNSMKPSENEDNPDDVAEIQKAEMYMGNFKLKTDPEYIVPEEKRMTPDKKRVQILKLDQGLYEVKMSFNKKFFELRDKKQEICWKVKEMNSRLNEINNQLGMKEVTDDPDMLLKETPELREVVTNEDIALHLARQGQEMKQNAASLGGFGDGQATKQPAQKEIQSTSGEAVVSRDWKAQEHRILSSILAHIPQSGLEKEEFQFRNCLLEREKANILRDIAVQKEDFDAALLDLRHRRLRREADVKYREMCRLVMFNELELLNDFHKREVALNTKLQDKLAEKGMIFTKISHCQERLEQKKSELGSLVERQSAVITEFNEIVPESNEFHEALAKIFFRKIKRSNKRSGDDEDEGSDSDEDMDNEDFDDEEDDDDEEEEVCPSGCDQEIYTKVCDLREKRLDEEDLLNEFQKSIEQINKDKEQAAKKLKLVEQSLNAINSDIVHFQKEKQGELNKLDAVVMLNMHQMECLVDDHVPNDLTSTILFSRKEMSQLKKRILELDDEKLELRTEQRELKKDFVQLTKSKRLKEGTITDLETRMHNVQLLKFGQIIDLDLLDRVNLHQSSDEVKQQAFLQERKYARELEDWDQKIMIRAEELAAVTSINTTCLNKISDLTRFQMGLEKTLSTSQTRMLVDSQSHRRKETLERDQLIRRVNAQAATLESLKRQLVAIKRKDTSVYG